MNFPDNFIPAAVRHYILQFTQIFGGDPLHVWVQNDGAGAMALMDASNATQEWDAPAAIWELADSVNSAWRNLVGPGICVADMLDRTTGLPWSEQQVHVPSAWGVHNAGDTLTLAAVTNAAALVTYFQAHRAREHDGVVFGDLLFVRERAHYGTYNVCRKGVGWVGHYDPSPAGTPPEQHGKFLPLLADYRAVTKDLLAVGLLKGAAFRAIPEAA